MKQTVKTSFWFDKSDNMVERMQKLGFSYATLSKALGYKQRSTICDIFNGRQPCPEHTLNKLIELGFDFSEMNIL